MADKTVGMLENVPALHDESLIPVEQSGELMNATGKQFREFAEQAAEQYVEDATEVAEKAEQALAALGNDAQIAQQAAVSASADAKRAKLYADQTEASVSGVASFNGRGGHVVPQSGDYTADMVGSVPVVMSGRGTVEVLFGDHNALKNYRDSTVPSAPVVANYTHFITYDTAGKVYSVLSVPDDHTSLACMYSVVAKKWFTFATTDTALMRDGSNAMTGSLSIKPTGVSGYSQMYKNAQSDSNDWGTVLLDRDSTGAMYGLKLRSMYKQARITDGSAEHDILHTGNKPSGSYTGNGDATERTINIGGIGEWVGITGGGYNAIIGYSGGFGHYYNGETVIAIPTSQAFFVNGVLTIKTAGGILNYLNTPYRYEVF